MLPVMMQLNLNSYLHFKPYIISDSLYLMKSCLLLIAYL